MAPLPTRFGVSGRALEKRPPASAGASRAGLAVALALLAAACAGEPELVALSERDASIERDIRYATAENFVGARVPGYEAARCLLTPRAAEALSEVQTELRARGLGLRVFDCYRPQRAVDAFVRWAEAPEDAATRARHHPRVPKARLFELGYIARRSGHSRGSTVDLTVVRVGADGETTPLDMGTPFDFFDALSHTDSPDVGEAHRANRLVLRDSMRRRGFRNYEKEWWHYTLEGEPHPDAYFDVPIR